METWVDIKDYEGYYQVSDTGRVKSLDRVFTDSIGKKKKLRERILIPDVRAGYPSVTLSKDNAQTRTTIHRLVAIYFIPNPENKPEVNHIDGNKLNNHKDNLEWVTHSENKLHAFKTGLNVAPKGEDRKESKLTEAQVLEIRAINGISQELIAKKYNMSQSSISEIKSRKKWRHI